MYVPSEAHTFLDNTTFQHHHRAPKLNLTALSSISDALDLSSSASFTVSGILVIVFSDERMKEMGRLLEHQLSQGSDQLFPFTTCVHNSLFRDMANYWVRTGRT